ncbi:MAG TPA: helix-turn-helix transcriptional regulator [Candidatus Hydrogenedentes bacterium]|nr:helix-turn-helix transcriptional regulator [Candidatus Hydrogenedentota bacterium]
MNMTEALKKAIKESGLSHNEIERISGVNRLTIARFINGTTTLRLDKADDLMKFFGLKLVKSKKGRSK